MTSKKSSLNVFKFTFKDSFKSCIPISGFLFLVGIFNLLTSSLGQLFYDGFSPFKGDYVYIPEINSALFFAVLILFSCLYGLRIFSFVTSKKESNVYFSLGIRRKKLFYAKYLSGVANIAGVLFVYFALDYFSQWLINGSTTEGLIMLMFSVCSSLVLCLSAYTVCVFSFVNSASIVEGIIFTGVFGFSFPIFTVTLSEVVSQIVHGDAFGTAIYANSYGFYSNFWFTDIFGSFTQQVDLNVNLLKNDRSAFISPNWSGVIFAAAVVILLMLVTCKNFEKRTAETCGSVFKSKTLYKVTAVIIGIISAFIFIISTDMSRVSSLVIGFGIMFCIAIGACLALDNKFPVKLTVSLVIASIVFTASAYYGYGKDVPEADEIEEVQFSADFSYLNIWDSVEGEMCPVYSKEFSALGFLGKYNKGQVTHIVSESDIEWFADIYEEIVSEGYLETGDENTANYPISFTCLLKDGTKITRSYDVVSLDVYRKLLGFEKTEKGKFLLDLATNKVSTNEASNENSDNSEGNYVSMTPNHDYYYGMVGYNMYLEELDKYTNINLEDFYAGSKIEIALVDKDLSYVGRIDSSDKNDKWFLKNEFLDILLKDMENQTIDEKYFHNPDDEIGALLISTEESFLYNFYDVVEGYENLDKTDLYYDDFYNYCQEIYFYDEIRVPHSTDIETALKTAVEKSALNNHFNIVVITKDMTNVIEYLKNAGLYDKLIKPEDKPTKIKMDKAENIKMTAGEKFSTNGVNENYCYSYSFYYYYSDVDNIYSTKEITDEKVIETLYNNSLMRSNKVYGNYVIEFFFPDGRRVSRIVPASVVTDEIKTLLN